MAAGVLAALAVLAGTTAVRAGDTFRLNLTKDNAADVQTLGFDGAADTVAVRGYHGGYGGYHGGYGGYHGYHGGYGGYHGYHGGYGGYRGYAGYRGFYAHNYYPYYRNRYFNSFYPSVAFGLGYYRPYYYSSDYYYPSYYYSAPSYYYSAPPVYYYSAPSCPIGVSVTTQPYSETLSLPSDSSGPRPTMPAIPQGEALQGDGSYPYDGGPRAPVPIPRAEPAPIRVPSPATVPLEGRVVSMPAQPSKFAYPAYGEESVRTSFAQDRTIPVKNEVAAKSKK